MKAEIKTLSEQLSRLPRGEDNLLNTPCYSTDYIARLKALYGLPPSPLGVKLVDACEIAINKIVQGGTSKNVTDDWLKDIHYLQVCDEEGSSKPITHFLRIL